MNWPHLAAPAMAVARRADLGWLLIECRRTTSARTL
jgi:hypothetical protein